MVLKFLGSVLFGSTSDRTDRLGIGYCPLRITPQNQASFREDPRFKNLLSRYRGIPPTGFCSATPNPGQILACSQRAEHCSRATNMDLCDTSSYGGDTYRLIKGKVVRTKK